MFHRASLASLRFYQLNLRKVNKHWVPHQLVEENTADLVALCCIILAEFNYELSSGIWVLEIFDLTNSPFCNVFGINRRAIISGLRAFFLVGVKASNPQYKTVTSKSVSINVLMVRDNFLMLRGYPYDVQTIDGMQHPNKQIRSAG